MSDDIRIRVATEMGWKMGTIVNSRRACGSHSCQTRVHIQWIHEDAEYSPILHEGESSNLPDYTTSADAALTLCDRLAVDLWTQSMWRTADGKWNVVFGLGTKSGEATADSLAMAVCLAFLKVRESQKEGA